MMQRFSAFATVVTLLELAAAAAAQDVPGSADHQMIARFKGSVIRAQARQDFAQYILPLGPADKAETKFQKQRDLEGKVLKTLYEGPAGSSPLAVYRSYQTALQQAGFATLFTCSVKQCSPEGRLQYAVKATRAGDYIKDLGGHSLDDDAAYLLVAHQAKNDVHVVVYATQLWHDPTRVVYMVDVIEPKPLKSGLVTIDAKVMADDISQAGHVALYGIYFDTGKAVLKPESKPALVEIAKLLDIQPTLKLHVVGHTDNAGTLAKNMALSRERADAVVTALATDYHIAAARLIANGVGPLAPVAPNSTEEGRGKNRRVELVPQ
jgi:OOP family OmpA-OmpF porin